ncbi:uncharacterized protein L969DRAFT_19716 [Mixia osmundae IAM 14324]|uniref:Uracil-DNA glycosylase n=1 Tax=Mixia osmundae (strain CBS 9802 / IAM 14324 / JCM 22182 / KY 12970) TaxID=764103 RepID=G7DZK8_MIXOS|nr:uncharacterized protein L969DRAFT_19716 [Mixia osmundae IAM 14324]KEI37181.1 hypothetical protein L969DRAFT_19716 [Mixia osmundae IAM 14324]GAA96018.1 hypothetical protein E5Q_02678 [Mixia osmundae IAM 14324]
MSSPAKDGKRQLTLDAMFKPPAKKVKVTETVETSDSNGAVSTTVSSVISASSAPALTRLEAYDAVKFDQQAFLAKLSTTGDPCERDLLDLEMTTLGSTWLKVLAPEIKKPYFLTLKRFLWREGLRQANVQQTKIFPPAPDVYAWSRHTPLTKVRVVIIGQDPYHQPGNAHGLCFSVRPGLAVPASLKNMYSELQQEYTDFKAPKHGNLEAWAKSGVLLLNTSLTVRANEAGSHAKQGWETFTDAVISLVDKYGGAALPDTAKGVGGGVVFMAWGAWAAKRVARLDRKKHLILTSAHPSPLSAHKGFLGNGHFKKANEWLNARHGSEGQIDWTNLPVKTNDAVTA